MSAKIYGLKDGLRGKGRPLKIATGLTVRDNRVTNTTITWEQLIEKLRAVERTKETLEQYFKAAREVQDRIKDVGHYVPGHFDNRFRKKAGLHERNLVTLDIDHAEPDYLDDVKMVYGGNAFALHTTHKHKAEAPRLRLVFPLTRPVAEAEYLAVSRKLAARLGMDLFDDTTYQFARVMHWPSASSDGEFVFEEGFGEWIDPDKILSEYKDWRDIGSWPKSSREDELRMSGRKAENPLEKRGIVGNFCRAYTICEAIDQFIPGTYTRGATDDRLTYAQGTTSNGAVVYGGGVWLYSHHESDPCGGRLVNAFDMVRLHLFGDKDARSAPDTAPTSMPSYREMLKLASENERVLKEIVRERFNGGESDFDEFGDPVQYDEARAPQPESPGADPSDGEKSAESDTPQELDLKPNQRGYFETLRNLEEILTKDARLRGKIAFNLFTRDLLQTGPLPGMRAAVPPEGVLWNDTADIKIKSYIERRYRLTFSTTMVHEGVMSVAERNAFNPVLDYFESLEWDGVKRVEEFFIREYGSRDSAYTRDITRKFFAAVVARVYNPGIKFDYMLVLEGKQGARKSSLFRALAKGWFSDDMSFGYESREVVERARNAIIVEIPELVMGRRAETEHIKAFISRQTDRARPAYARYAQDFPRQFVIVGSTNESNYLTDASGNRRWWVLNGDGRTFDLERIRGDVDQLWAEAKALWQGGEPLWLDRAESVAEAEAMQAERLIDDDWLAAVTAWLDRPIRSDHWDRAPGVNTDFDDAVSWVVRDRTCALEVWTECLGGEVDKLNRQVQTRIGDLLRRLGWKRKAVRFGSRYGRTMGFTRDIPLDDGLG